MRDLALISDTKYGLPGDVLVCEQEFLLDYHRVSPRSEIDSR